MDITLEDVEVAIRILNEFLKKSEDAKRTLRRFGVSQKSSSGFGFNPEQIMNMVLAQQQAKKGIVENEVAVEPPSENDLKRMREIAEKIKKSSTT